jgi:hypothetical protein
MQHFNNDAERLSALNKTCRLTAALLIIVLATMIAFIYFLFFKNQL